MAKKLSERMKKAIAPGKTTKTKKTKLGFGELGLRHETGGGPDPVVHIFHLWDNRMARMCDPVFFWGLKN
jgi:hypothetical protein